MRAKNVNNLLLLVFRSEDTTGEPLLQTYYLFSVHIQSCYGQRSDLCVMVSFTSHVYHRFQTQRDIITIVKSSTSFLISVQKSFVDDNTHSAECSAVHLLIEL